MTVKSTQRHAAAAAGILALSLLGAPAFGQRGPVEPPQRGGQPKQDTPYILIATFRSNDRLLGVQAADEVRKRVASEHSAQELFVVTKHNINTTLEASGYRADSALNASDLMELSKQLHGEYVLDASVTKNGNAVRIEPRLMMRTGQVTLTQPLPTIDGKDAGDAAKGVERAITDALKGIPAYRTCVNDLRAQKFDAAVKDAQTGIQLYPNSSLSRLCLLQALTSLKAPADSIISVSNAILAIEPTSMIALQNLAEGYRAKGDTAKAIETNLRIYRADPSNTAIATSIVDELARSGAPDKALPIIDSLLKDNPGDPGIMKTKWLLQLRGKQYKQALATGEELVKVDTAFATVDYFSRSIGAAQSDSNTAAVQQLAAKASQKFPKEVSFANLLAQSYYKAGQLQQALQAARRAADIDPKSPSPWLFILAIQNQLNQPDSMLASAQKAIAGGVPKDSLGASLLAVAGPALKKAQDSKSREDWEAALKASQTVDAVVPSAQSKFYIGVAAFSIGADAVAKIQTLAKGNKDDKAKACLEVKAAEDAFATSLIAMPAGAAYDKATAGTIMGGVGQYSEYVTQVKNALKCK
jgi:tetratricopeptide (TPR) repeat protein